LVRIFNSNPPFGEGVSVLVGVLVNVGVAVNVGAEPFTEGVGVLVGFETTGLLFEAGANRPLPLAEKGDAAYTSPAKSPVATNIKNAVRPKRILECLFWFTVRPLK